MRNPEANLEATTWQNFPAWRFSNAHLEAVVVPALARVMHFGRPGSRNWMWMDPRCLTGDHVEPSPDPWLNWGGDKTWLSPQADWSRLTGQGWPPDPAWGHPVTGRHEAEPLPDGGLRVIGPVSRATGLRVRRDYHLDGAGWVTTQIVENLEGPTHVCGIWSVTDIALPDATYFVPAAQSAYPRGIFEFEGCVAPELTAIGGLLIGDGKSLSRKTKFGFDSPVAALAARFGDEVLVQRAECPSGEYPDGLPEAGLSVEYYDSGPISCPFAEMELLGPLVRLERGQGLSHTMRWHLEILDESPDSPVSHTQIFSALHRPLPVARVQPHIFAVTV